MEIFVYKCDKLFKKLDILEGKYIKLWENICNIESPTDYKAGLDAVSAYINNEAVNIGLKSEIIKQAAAGNLVKVTLDNKSGQKPVIISAHIDTVHPVGSFGNPPVKTAEGIMYGPGVIDDKGGAAAALYAIEALKLCGYTKRNVIFIAQTDEEVSSELSNHSTINYICNEAQKCEVFINCESFHKGEAILRRKGIARYRFYIKGKTAHSARCHLGASALLEAAHKIIDIEKFKDKDGITCNCSLITGGEVANSVPDKCEFTVDARYFSASQFYDLEKALKEIAERSYIGNTQCDIVCESKRPAMELNERNLAFLDKVNKIYKSNGLDELTAGTSQGGSDAANISASGITTIDSVGCEGGKIHTLEEFAYIRSLKEAAARIASIIYCYDETEY